MQYLLSNIQLFTKLNIFSLELVGLNTLLILAIILSTPVMLNHTSIKQLRFSFKQFIQHSTRRCIWMFKSYTRMYSTYTPYYQTEPVLT